MNAIDKVRDLPDAIAEFVHEGDTIAMEGFTHLIPFAAAHEIIRQRITHLTAVRLTPDLIYDQLIGAGCISKLVFSWGGNPGVGSLHRFRDAIENEWPCKLEIEEHNHAGLTNRYIAGASGLPFTVMRGYFGTDLMHNTRNVAQITSPFGDEAITAVAAINPDVTIIHAQQADRAGNIMMWGIVGVQKEAVYAARHVIVTVEEIVEFFEPKFNSVIIPSILVSAVCVVPGGATPSYALGYYGRDNSKYIEWADTSKDRAAFENWLHAEIYDGVKSHDS